MRTMTKLDMEKNIKEFNKMSETAQTEFKALKKKLVLYVNAILFLLGLLFGFILGAVLL
jgi:hypothetical protein